MHGNEQIWRALLIDGVYYVFVKILTPTCPWQKRPRSFRADDNIKSLPTPLFSYRHVKSFRAEINSVQITPLISSLTRNAQQSAMLKKKREQAENYNDKSFMLFLIIFLTFQKNDLFKNQVLFLSWERMHVLKTNHDLRYRARPSKEKKKGKQKKTMSIVFIVINKRLVQTKCKSKTRYFDRNLFIWLISSNLIITK